MKRILIVGFGDVAERLVKRYAGQAEFVGMIRRPERAAALRALGVTPYVGDLDVPQSLRRLPRVDGVFHFAPPPADGKTDPRTAHLLHALARRGKPGALVYISTSGVYGDCGGDWVAETRPVAPVNGRAVRRVDAERQLRAWGEAHAGAGEHSARAGHLRCRPPAAGTHPARHPGAGCRGRQLYQPHPCRRSGAAGMGGAVPWPFAAHLPCGRCTSAENGRLVRQLRRCLRPAAAAAGERAEAEKVLSEALLSFLRESRQLSNARTTRELRLKYRYPTSDDLLREIRQARSDNPAAQMKLF